MKMDLWDLIKRWKRAIRLKAHPKLIQKFEEEMKKESERVAASLQTRGDSVEEIVKNLKADK